MKLKLNEICDIKLGSSLSRFRNDSITEKQKKYKYKVLTLKSLQDEYEIPEDSYDIIEIGKEIKDDFIAKKGDSIVRLRTPVKAIDITDKEEGIVIQSLFSIVRVKDQSKVLPEYVTIYLNSKKVEKQLLTEIQGTSIMTISNQVLSQIEIEVPSMKKQLEIVKLDRLLKREKRLLELLQEKRKILFENIISNVNETN